MTKHVVEEGKLEIQISGCHVNDYSKLNGDALS